MKKPLIVIGLVLLTCFACLPGNTSTKHVTLQLLAFHDRNGDGTQFSDSYSDEGPVPDTLIIIESNIHGIMRRDVILTGADGKAAIDVDYTHILAVKAVPPCGSSPTTAINQDLVQRDPAASDLVAFGFWNVAAAGQHSIVRLHLWEDRDRNGTRDAGETPSNAPFFVKFNIPNAMGSYSTDNMPMPAASDGVSLDLGNSCGEINLLLTPGWKTTSVSSPARVTDAEMQEVSIPYQPGTVELDWGVFNEP